MELPWSAAARLARDLRRARAGDREAFAGLYRALYPTVLAFVARRCPQPADRDDAVSRTFHRMLERMGSWDEARGGVLPFTLAIARNLLLDEARARRPTVGLDEAAQSLVDHATPLRALERGQNRLRLLARLEALPKELRELFALRFADGLTNRQIAELVGLEEDAVKQRFSRALRELRETLVAEAAAGEEALR